jgi:thioesterase domain-containing protein/acyl carrier protein
LPALTAERFVPDPFSSEPGRRLYRSGDVGLMRAGAEMEYLGRTDEQVKIRGFRIELGEIESVLRQHPAVNDSSVVVQGTLGDKRLVGYVVLREATSHEQKEVLREEIREYLKRELPEYMVPVDVMVLEKMPLTSNGKVDRKALPLPLEMQLGQSGSYVAPSTDVEVQLVEIWQDILNVRPIGVTDNFFQRGGHSLLVVRLLARVEDQFGRELTISGFFQKPTIRDLVAALETDEVEEFPALVQIQRGGSLDPIFCVHSQGGDVGYFSRVAQYMGDEQPFYALQALAPTDLTEYVSIEEMAAHYLSEICKVRRFGPYHLGGHSFGSVIAFEMAQQLVRQGREVGLLALIGGGSPLVLKGLNSSIELMTVAGMARDIARMARVDFDLPHEEVQRLGREYGMEYALEYILDKCKRTNLLSDKVGLPWIRRFIRGVMLQTEAVKNYQPDVYDGVITYYTATESELENEKAWESLGIDDSPTHRWEELSTKPLVIRKIPGFHSTMTDEPNVQVLAEQLCLGIRESVIS